MAVTLAANISADAREFTVSGTVPDEIAPGYLFRLANELLILRSFARADIADAPVDPVRQPELVGRNRHIWIVGRGLQGTTKATHTAGTSIIGSADAFASSSDATTPSPFPAGGGGAVDSVNGQTGVVVLDDTAIDTTAPLTGPTVHDELVALGVLAGAGPLIATEPETGALRAKIELAGDSETGVLTLSVWTGDLGVETQVASVVVNATGATLTAGGGAGSSVAVNLDGTIFLTGAAGGIEIHADGIVVLNNLTTSEPTDVGGLWVDTTSGLNIVKVHL